MHLAIGDEEELMSASVTPGRVCRVCGCTDFEPCISPGGETCRWIEDDLCDFCDIEGSDAEPLVELFSESDLDRMIARRRAAGA